MSENINAGGRTPRGVRPGGGFKPKVTGKSPTGKEGKGIGKTAGAGSSGPVDGFYPQHDINPDTMQKIPGFVHKYFTKGNKVKVLYDKEITPKNDSDSIFPQVEKMIRSAKKSVQIEMFNLDKKSIVDTLIDEAKKGKKVQVIMDPPNEGWEQNRKAAIDKLKKNGVDVQIYPAKEAGSKGARYGQLNHVKMMIVDGKRAIIGGMNWGEHSKENRDFDVMVEGPAVNKMGWHFREDWERSGGDTKELPWIGKTDPKKDGTAAVNFIKAGMEKKDRIYGMTVNRAIKNANKSVHAQLFVLSDRRTVANLIKAKERGVDVKVILSPLKIEGKPINEKAATQLKEAGVPVRWFKGNEETKQKMHGKMATFDDDQSIVGSANWSYYGFNVNREAGLEILSKDVNRDLDRVFVDDWENKTTADPVYFEKPNEDAGG